MHQFTFATRSLAAVSIPTSLKNCILFAVMNSFSWKAFISLLFTVSCQDIYYSNKNIFKLKNQVNPQIFQRATYQLQRATQVLNPPGTGETKGRNKFQFHDLQLCQNANGSLKSCIFQADTTENKDGETVLVRLAFHLQFSSPDALNSLVSFLNDVSKKLEQHFSCDYHSSNLND